MAYLVMALYSYALCIYGPMHLWPYTVMAHTCRWRRLCCSATSRSCRSSTLVSSARYIHSYDLSSYSLCSYGLCIMAYVVMAYTVMVWFLRPGNLPHARCMLCHRRVRPQGLQPDACATARLCGGGRQCAADRREPVRSRRLSRQGHRRQGRCTHRTRRY